MKSKIKNILSRQILDSRGIPSIETEIELESGIKAAASVPAGTSTGLYEAFELRDNDKMNYFGKGVLKAVANVENIIKPLLIGVSVYSQNKIDKIIIEKDGSKNKSKLGANAILSVSLAAAKAAAKQSNMPLYKYLGGVYGVTMPKPMINILNGGLHANNNTDIQEFMIQPDSSCDIKDSIKIGAEVFHSLKKELDIRSYSTSVGDEGGFAPNLKNNKEALELISCAIRNAGYTFKEIKICLDIAASELYKNNKYMLKSENKEYTTDEFINYLENLSDEYPIISIEDGLAQNDIQGWIKMTQRMGKSIQLVGDDLFATNYERLKEGIECKMANAILIKPNQIGTLTETLHTIRLAQKNNYKTIISHRSGETEDTFIADLAVAVNSGQIKTGSVSRGERTAKYNRLIRIQDEIYYN